MAKLGLERACLPQKSPFLVVSEIKLKLNIKIEIIYRLTIFSALWLPSPKVSKLELLTVVRYLGVTPTSSSVPTLVLSICQQICYHMEVSLNLFLKERSFRSQNA